VADDARKRQREETWTGASSAPSDERAIILHCYRDEWTASTDQLGLPVIEIREDLNFGWSYGDSRWKIMANFGLERVLAKEMEISAALYWWPE
jgi:hypothetical protein